MSQGNQDPQLQAEQIDIIRKKPSLKLQPEVNYLKEQYFLFYFLNSKLELKSRVLKTISQNQFFSKTLEWKISIVYQKLWWLNKQNPNNWRNQFMRLINLEECFYLQQLQSNYSAQINLLLSHLQLPF
ncbi:unnamed protein product [Paramecium octaurelia]|uniref:Uncharacterized protein n=1 Tax=Paramecium octaurelia TaxID=43137 RepID=A0A8S1UWL4_PAROT|nr:unnamed protein product [Paramecium octaurelia]